MKKKINNLSKSSLCHEVYNAFFGLFYELLTALKFIVVDIVMNLLIRAKYVSLTLNLCTFSFDLACVRCAYLIYVDEIKSNRFTAIYSIHKKKGLIFFS